MVTQLQLKPLRNLIQLNLVGKNKNTQLLQLNDQFRFAILKSHLKKNYFKPQGLSGNKLKHSTYYLVVSSY